MNNNQVTQSGGSNKVGTGRLLAMDTSTSSMSVALLEDGRLLKEINSTAERNHSIYLMPNIRDALAELGWQTKDLEGIAVGRGPGSYTGVRIGVTVAKTMAWALKVPVVGVSSLEAMAAGAYRELAIGGIEAADAVGKVWVVPMVNARRGQAFTAWFQFDAGAEDVSQVDGEGLPVGHQGWSRKREDGIRQVAVWTQELLEEIRRSEIKPVHVLFVGETEEFVPLIEDFACEASKVGRISTKQVLYRIQAEYIGYLGYERIRQGDLDETHHLLPNYTQLAEAEANLLKR